MSRFTLTGARPEPPGRVVGTDLVAVLVVVAIGGVEVVIERAVEARVGHEVVADVHHAADVVAGIAGASRAAARQSSAAVPASGEQWSS